MIVADLPTETTLDTDRAEAFTGRLVGILSDASVALMLSVGHRVGLFDTLAQLPPSTSATIAERAGLRERYVREWLGAMVTGEIVEYDPATATYVLPPEHAASLTRAAGSDNIARTMQFVPLLAQVEPDVVTAFREGGGVPYTSFGEFHQLMDEDSRAGVDEALVDAIVPLVPGLVDRLAAGISVADVGCGSGHAVNVLARAFPASSFVGYDFSDEAIARARQEAQEWGLGNARFELRDVSDLSGAGPFDLVTAFDAIHDQAHPAEVLSGVASILARDGIFLMVDIKASSHLEDNLEIPWGPFLYTVSTMHCMTVSLALGGDGLGTVWGEQTATRMLHDAGFSSVDVHELEDDPFNNFYVATL